LWYGVAEEISVEAQVDRIVVGWRKKQLALEICLTWKKMRQVAICKLNGIGADVF
jgi:hypothetical protein